MSAKFIVIQHCEDYYYKLPDDIKTLEDDRVERYIIYHNELIIKLKDNDERIIIAPTYSDDEGYFNYFDKEYCEEKDTPFYESDDNNDNDDDDK